jgi:hypothetical protein
VSRKPPPLPDEFPPDVARRMEDILAALAALPPRARAETLRRARALAPASRSARRDDAAILTSELSALDDPSDPLAALQACGSLAALGATLSGEPLGVLQAMLRHPSLPPGPAPRSQTRAALARAIVQRLAQREEARS